MTAPSGRLAAVLLAALLGLLAAAALEGQSPDGGRETALLVTADDLLFKIENFGQEYGGGVGLKVGQGSEYFRFLLNLFLNTASNGFSAGLGTTYEHHLSPGPLSPYWGLTGFLGLETQRDQTDSLNYISLTDVPISAAGLFGVEIFVTDHVSLFFEYAVALELTISHTAMAVAGAVSRSTSADIKLDAGLGNQSKLGLAIYLPPGRPRRAPRPRLREVPRASSQGWP